MSCIIQCSLCSQENLLLKGSILTYNTGILTYNKGLLTYNTDTELGIFK